MQTIRARLVELSDVHDLVEQHLSKVTIQQCNLRTSQQQLQGKATKPVQGTPVCTSSDQ
jgi:hypothetical protein